MSSFIWKSHLSEWQQAATDEVFWKGAGVVSLSRRTSLKHAQKMCHLRHKGKQQRNVPVTEAGVSNLQAQD